MNIPNTKTPLLDQVDLPEDLRKLERHQLRQFADELRTDLIDLWVDGRLPAKAMLLVTHNIEEAVLMCDRILVFSSNPGRVMAEIKVDLPHPRNRLDPAFRALVDDIYARMTPPTASPTVKDLFIQIDFMTSNGYTTPLGVVGPHSHMPSKAALDKVGDAFKNAPAAPNAVARAAVPPQLSLPSTRAPSRKTPSDGSGMASPTPKARKPGPTARTSRDLFPPCAVNPTVMKGRL